MTEKPPQPTPEKEPKDFMSFEEFTRRNPSPRYNNLVLYFYTTGSGPLYRQAEHFKRFEQEHPDLERRLREGLMSLSGGFSYSEDLRQHDADLYEAYKIMRSYGVSDRDIFA